MIRVQEEPFDPYAELERFTKKRPNMGAVASFVGLVRDEGDKVDALILDHYPGFTEKEIKRIETEARGRFDVADTLVIHRYGRMIPGEVIVLVAASALHRKDALEAVAFLMDYLKTEAPFWKRELGPDGETWIEPRAGDREARSQWAEED